MPEEKPELCAQWFRYNKCSGPCDLAHGVSRSKHARPELAAYNSNILQTLMCSFNIQGICVRNCCPFAHRVDQLRSNGCFPHVKNEHISICPQWLRFGSCKDSKCNKQHGLAFLKPDQDLTLAASFCCDWFFGPGCNIKNCERGHSLFRKIISGRSSRLQDAGTFVLISEARPVAKTQSPPPPQAPLSPPPVTHGEIPWDVFGSGLPSVLNASFSKKLTPASEYYYLNEEAFGRLTQVFKEIMKDAMDPEELNRWLAADVCIAGNHLKAINTWIGVTAALLYGTRYDCTVLDDRTEKANALIGRLVGFGTTLDPEPLLKSTSLPLPGPMVLMYEGLAFCCELTNGTATCAE